MRAIGIPLVVGLLANFIWPFMVPMLLFPAQLTLRPPGILYKYFGRTTAMSWGDISEISYRSISDGRYSSDGKWVVIKGKGRPITIPPMFAISAEEVGEIIRSYVNKNVKNGTSIIGDVLRNAEDDYDPGSAWQASQTSHQTQINKIRKVYTWIIIAITVFFMVAISLILYSISLVYPLR